METMTSALTTAELDQQAASPLPRRDLLLGISILGLPLVSLDGVDINVDTSGPNWLFGAVGDV